MGIFHKVPKKYLGGNNWANGFKTHNELIMYPLGKYPLATGVRRDNVAVSSGSRQADPFGLRGRERLDEPYALISPACSGRVDLGEAAE
jgi:hypothetical protein